ncbi:NAD(P)-dependent oxidoreductase [Levilactobacillus tongjiangensis]|uniref:NAD(P)-dependent oxidoreductase n=1 Tax=Levilactobacillus tongjiangensis TaxID=2486023 RepID=A0ABW1SQC1_9LACO|nr:NAD-dependent epimerase/dehydratase family protein [Levilactobacillus tongjiangensis]
MIIGAYGRLGRLVMGAASRRGYQVVGIAHRQHANSNLSPVQIKDMLDLTSADLTGIDAIVDAVGAWTPATEYVHTAGLAHIVSLLRGTPIHYLKVGASSTLFTNTAHTYTLQELPDYYPDYMQDLCNAHAEGLAILQSANDINWTYVTPTYNFDPNGQSTGTYHVTCEVFHAANSGNPDDGQQDYITYADFAKGMLDIIAGNQYIRQQITLFTGNNPHPTQRY